MSIDPPWCQPRTLADFGGLERLRPAERKLLAERDTGLPVVIGDGDVPPEDAPEDRRVRASFLRWLILGAEGAEGRTHEKGVQVRGAFVESDGPVGAETRGLDLEGCAVAQDVSLFACRFEDAPLLLNARLQGLYLTRSHLPGLGADQLEMTGSVFLSGIASDGAIRLLGARIAGDLSCTGAALRNADGYALSAANARIEGTLFLRSSTLVEGVIDLQAARIGVICDAMPCWPGTVQLDRCIYDAFVACPTDADTRIAWLDKTDDGRGFLPQPWEQCAKVLRETGHAEDARAVLIEKEKRQRAARRRAMRSLVMRGLWTAWDGVLGVTVRYGRQPMVAFLWLLGFWLLGAAHFSVAAERDAIKPNNAFILRGAEWALCGVPEGESVFLPSMDKAVAGLREEGETRRACFERQEEAQSYPAFNALIYSADTLLPIVSLEMQEYWISDDRVRDLGLLARGYLWLHIALGWALSLLAVAGFSGIVKSD